MMGIVVLLGHYVQNALPLPIMLNDRIHCMTLQTSPKNQTISYSVLMLLLSAVMGVPHGRVAQRSVWLSGLVVSALGIRAR